MCGAQNMGQAANWIASGGKSLEPMMPASPAPTPTAAPAKAPKLAAAGGDSLAGGAGTAVQATPLLTPAFMPGTPGFKALTGQ